MIGTIGLEALQIRCIVGIYPQERVDEQDLLLDVSVETDFEASASSDPASIQLDLQGAGSSHPRRYACVEAGHDRRPPHTGQSEPGGLSADSLVQKTGQGGVSFYRVTAGLAITPDTREHVSGLTASRWSYGQELCMGVRRRPR